jgi:hypothetical protein
MSARSSACAHPATAPAAPATPAPNTVYQALLTWAFIFFGSLRVLSYLPTLWVIAQQQNSSQHSLLTWCTWLGANLTMAAWLHEHNGWRSNHAVVVNLLNAAMCGASVALIAWFRF